MVISVVVTGRLTVAEASSRYGIPYVTLYNSVLGHQNRMGVLQKITLSREEEDQIMKYCVKPLPGRKAKKGITQPLEKIWEFLNCLKSFHEKADEFRFGEVSFYRWWWAFCRHHNIDVHPSKHVTRVNSESPSVDVATTLDDSETPIVDDGTNRVNEDDSTIPSWTRMAELKEAIFDIVTGQLSFPEASSQYNLSEHTLYSRILGQTDRMAVLQEVSLSIEEEDKILRLCTTIPPECTAKRIITQPLETIWDFMHHLGDFREKADQFRFGGIAFYRWFWAFCQKHNVDERLPKQETN
ncbi:AAEL005591-PA [Aedes aegypti]|nr:AAEL005591-PA [Aedes aegypti]